MFVISAGLLDRFNAAPLYVEVVSAVLVEPQIPADPLHENCKNDVDLPLSTRRPRSSSADERRSRRVANRVAKMVKTRFSEIFPTLPLNCKCLNRNDLHPAGLEPATL